MFVPSGPNAPPGGGFAAETTSVEYEINCFPGAPGASAEGATLHLAGTLARTGSFDGGSSGPTAVWKVLVELRPGSCVIQLISRADRELICNIEEPLTIEPGSPSELFLEMPCHTYVHCTTTPLPDSVRSAKTVCESLVGVISSAETPAALEDAQSIRYVLSEIWSSPGEKDPALIARHEGSLLFVGTGTEDFGEGIVATDNWDGAIEEVAAGPGSFPKPYLLELTALDSQGEPLCTDRKASRNQGGRRGPDSNLDALFWQYGSLPVNLEGLHSHVPLMLRFPGRGCVRRAREKHAECESP